MEAEAEEGMKSVVLCSDASLRKMESERYFLGTPCDVRGEIRTYMHVRRRHIHTCQRKQSVYANIFMCDNTRQEMCENVQMERETMSERF